jgi:hypothetical protein
VVLEVVAGEDAVLELPGAAPVHERGGQVEVGAQPRLPEQLDQRHLHLGMAAHPLVREPLHHQVREPLRHPQQPLVAHPARRGDGGLDEVTQVVQLVPPGQVLPRLLRGGRVLEEGVEVAVLGLDPLQEADDLLEELPYGLPRAAVAQLVGQALQGLVQVGVQERVAAAVRRRVLLQEAAQVGDVAGRAELLDGVRDRGRAVPVLPVVQQTTGDTHSRKRPYGPGGRAYGAGQRLDLLRRHEPSQ